MAMPAVPRPPYLGAAYYPELWPVEQIDRDIARMTEAGINLARIAEFAWAYMEPAEGRYEFDWLHHVVAKLAAAGVAVVMCTPTAAPPAWLTEKHPEMRIVDAEGRRHVHGSRRHYCPHSRVFQQYCRKITRAMAAEFAEDPAIVAWQTDNEFSCHQFDSFTPAAKAAWHEWLAGRYHGDIEELNAAWGTGVWSQRYDRFDQVPMPVKTTYRHHPSLLYHWKQFSSLAWQWFQRVQLEELRTSVKAPILHNAMSLGPTDWDRILGDVDIAAIDVYPGEDGLARVTVEHDWLRTLKSRPHWVMETGTCWNGDVVSLRHRRPGWCRAGTWLNYAAGAETVSYWLFRAHWSGQEVGHGSVLYADGQPMHIFGEVQQVGREIRKAAEFLNACPVARARLAVSLSVRSYHLFGVEPMDEQIERRGYGGILREDVFGPLQRGHVHRDALLDDRWPDCYDVIFSPLLPVVTSQWLEQMRMWVEAGGTWVIGPLTGCRTEQATKFQDSRLGPLEKLAGVHTRHSLPATPHEFAMKWADGRTCGGSLWYDALEPTGAEPLATYADGELAGLAAVTRRAVGKGQVILLGTLPPAPFWMALLRPAAGRPPIEPAAGGGEHVVVYPRSGAGGEGAILVETAGEPATLRLPRGGVDLLTDAAVEGEIHLGPYAVAAVRYTR